MEGYILVGEVVNVEMSSYENKSGKTVEECLVTVASRSCLDTRTKGSVADSDYQVGEMVALHVQVLATMFGSQVGLRVLRVKKLDMPTIAGV
jgi:hypothetical protein